MTDDLTDLIQDEENQRFVLPMPPSDAFITYVWRGDTMVLTHAEVDPALRGTGTGGRFVSQVLEHLMNTDTPVSATCPFIRRVASSRPEWRQRFGIDES